MTIYVARNLYNKFWIEFWEYSNTYFRHYIEVSHDLNSQKLWNERVYLKKSPIWLKIECPLCLKSCDRSDIEKLFAAIIGSKLNVMMIWYSVKLTFINVLSNILRAVFFLEMPGKTSERCRIWKVHSIMKKIHSR